jgi:polysaccharide biosynthesis transport protein
MSAHADIDIGLAEPVAPPAPPEQSPLAGLIRAMRGRWLAASAAALILGPLFATGGFLAGVELYQSTAILRLFPQESNILYRSGDDSVLKTFDSFVKAETTAVASDPVMDRARTRLAEDRPDAAAGMSTRDLAGSIEIKRNDSLITLTTLSRDPAFATAKVDAVVSAYLDLQAEVETARSNVRLEELQSREEILLARQAEIRSRMLMVGGEYGTDALAKAHVEKVAQIDALSARRAEIEATLVALRTASGESSADMSDNEIMRATLLDRALADLNFDRAKRLADLSTLLLRYPDASPQVQDLREQIAVIDRAMSERREQIKVLGQTGALTDTSGANAEASQAEIAALLDKVTGQLAVARTEARDLNGKRAELEGLQEEANDVRKLLEETSAALEMIRLEAGRALPGYSAVLSPASLATKPAEDSRRLLAAAGLGGGSMLPFAVALLLGLTARRLRYSDALLPHSHRVPILRVVPRRNPAPSEPDRLRNALLLHPLRQPHPAGAARVVTFTRLDRGVPSQTALELARSFASAGLRVLLIDADPVEGRLSRQLELADMPGWSELLLGQTAEPVPMADGLMLLPAGKGSHKAEFTTEIASLRALIARLSQDQDLVLICARDARDSLLNELFLSLSDLAMAEVCPGDRKSVVASQVLRLDTLPRQGGCLVFQSARPGDPGLLD